MKKIFYFLIAMIFAIQGWSQVISTFPWNEGFESGLTNWTQQFVSGTNSWSAASSASQITSAQEGTQFARYSHSSTGNTTKLVSPVFDISALTNPTMFFWYTQSAWGTDQNTIKVYYRNDTVSTSTWTEILYLSQNTPSWTMVTLPLTNGSSTYQIAFEGYDDWGYPVGLDNVTILDLTCPAPTNIIASNPTLTGVDLGWTDATGSLWNIQYMLATETDWANATTISGVTNPYIFTTLNSSTAYKARVQTDCGADQSLWSSTITFATACDAITTFPWHEGFEGDWVSITAPGNRPAPNCWTVVDRGVEDSYYDYFWESNVDMSYSGTSHSGSRHAACYTDYGDSDHNDWLISPMISLTGNERLRFWAMRANNSTGEPDEISVYISDDTFTTLDTTGMGQTGNMPGFTQIFTQALPVGDWVQYEINLNQHVGNKYIAFVRQGTPDGYVLRLDDVEISELPTCMRPTNVTVSNITTTDAEVSWTNGNSADAAWWIYYKQTTATTYDSVQVFSNPYTLTTLIPSSGYDIYVVTDCSTELSEASPIVNFRTLCDEISELPWSDNFDTYGTTEGSFPPCWTRPVINNPYVAYPSIYTYDNHTAPASIMFQTLTTTPTYAVTPAFTADLNTLMVSFWLKAEGIGSTQSGTITVGVMSNPNDTTTFEAVQLISPSTTDWTQYVIMLSGVQLQGSGNHIAFKHNSNANNWYYWLDDVEVDEIPACPNVYGLIAQPATTSSVSVNWNDEGDEGDGYVIAYASNLAAPFDPTTATTVTIPTGTTLPYIIPGFNAGDSVWVAVQRGCGGTWTTAQKVILPSFAYSLPFTANFEDTTLDTVWTIENGTFTNKWYIGAPGANDSDPTDGIDERGLYISSDNGATATYSSASSSIVFVSTLVEFDNSPAFELSFDWANNGEIDWHDLNVYLMPLSIALTPGTLPNSQYQINTASLAEETSFHTFTRVFDRSYSNSVKQLVFAWQNDTYGGNYNPPARVDNISFVALTCGMPYGLAMDSASYNGTDVYLHWTESQDATDWIVEYQQTGTTAWQQVAANSNPFTLTGLNPGTSYQARVRSICNATDTSAISNVINFQTACVALSVPTVVEGFNTVPPSTCWERKQGILPATGNASLSTTTSGWNLNSNVTPSNAKLNIYGTSRNYWLISPSIDLGDGTSPAQIEFDVFYTDYNNSNMIESSGNDDRFAVVVSTDNGNTWNAANATIWSNDTSATRVLDSIPNTPTHIVLPLFDPATTLPYTGIVKIGFYGESTVSNADNDLHIDNFEVLPLATCQRPTSLVASAITTTSADVSFQENGTATTWQYVLTDGTITDPSNGTPVSTTDNPIQLTGLTPQTEYTIWVRSDCTTETSIWSTPLTFVTEAPPATVPYSFDFENQTEALAWRNLSGSVNNWAIGQAAGNGPSTQNTTDNTAAYISNNNGVSYAMTDGYIYAYGYRDIDFGATPASYSLTFDWKCQGYVYNSSAYSGLIVYLRDITDTLNPTGYPSNVNDNLGLFAQQSTWQTEQLPLDNVSGVKRLIFFYFDQYYNYTPPAAIDNISIVAEPCPRPFDVTVSNTTTTTAEVSWNHPGATDFIVSYRTNTTGSTLIDIPASTSPLTISGLTAGTQYLLAVRAICNGDTTIYSETVQFTTPCVDGAISSFPWTEGFESGIACWQQEYVSGAIDWTNEDNYSSSTSSSTPAHGGQKLAYFFDDSYSGYTTKLVSPLLDISGLATPYVSFWHLQKVWLSDQDELKVFYRASSDSSWTQLVHYSSNISSWQLDSVALPSASSTYQIAFEGIQNYGYGVGLDDITVYDPSGSSCEAPTNLIVSNIQNTTATVSWIPAGTESAWQVRLGTTGTPEDVTSTTYTFPSTLTPGTHYTYFVRANCGTNYSAWVQDTFTTTAGHQAVQVTTIPPTTITQNGAMFQATYVQGSEAVTAIGFEYRDLASSTWTDQTVSPVATPFTHQATNLTANTTYKVRAYAVTPTDGRVFGDTLEFTTLEIVAPIVTTDSVSNILTTGATFHGSITPGSEDINARGFEYKLQTQTWEEYNEISATGTNPISATITNLLPNTNYDVRAYARTVTQKYYGNVYNFSTTTLYTIDQTPVTIMMYPNPASQETKLVVTGLQGEVKITISDVQGRIINTINTKANNNKVEETINVSNMANGVYYVRLQNDQISRTQKLIVK
jgi:hypothetical protein